MARPRSPKRDRAHHLLLEWACGLEAAGGNGYPPAPLSANVQGSRSEITSPERYAHDLRRWATIDNAVRAVGRRSEAHGVLIRERYGNGYGEQRCADRANLSLRRWREQRDEAMDWFIDAYESGAHTERTAAQIAAESGA